MANRWEKMETVVDFIFLASKMTVDSDCNQNKRCLLLRRKDMPNLDSVLKIRDIILLTKICTVKSMGFFSVVMYGCESSTKKKAEHWRTGDFELWWRRLLRVPWIARRSNQPWIFFGRTDAEAEAPILWRTDAKSQLLGKDLNAGKHCGQEKNGVTEDEIVGCHHWLNGHEFEQILGDSEGQGNLACCSPQSWKELDMTLLPRNNNKN